MSTCAIIVEQVIAGQKFETVHGAQSELDLGGEDMPLTDTFLLELFGGVLPGQSFDALTDPESGIFVPSEAGMIGSIIAFHRYMQADIVNITRIYITDGKKGPGNPGPVFYSLPVQLQCRGIGMFQSGVADNVAPTNQALLINKVPKGFGRRAGRIFLRAAMQYDDLAVGGPNGVTIRSDRVNAVKDRLQNAINASEFDLYLDTGTDADQAAVYAILNYWPKGSVDDGGSLEGQVQGSTGVSAFRFGGVTGRQTNRPSKKSA